MKNKLQILVIAAACHGLFAVSAHAASDAPESNPVTIDTGSVALDNAAVARIVSKAMDYIGVMYIFGGADPRGFDCSGFTQFVFEKGLGIKLPRRAVEQAAAAEVLEMRRDHLRPGDLVFFNTHGTAVSHVGIYLGEDKFIHSPRTGRSVSIDDMSNAYWTARFVGARHMI